MRKKKYDWLSENDIKTAKWQKLSPKSQFYLFIPREEKLLEVYGKFLKITDIFPVNSVGIVTSRDKFVIDFDKEALKRRFRMFRDAKMPDEIIRETFHLKDKSNWKLTEAREKVRKEENWEDLITQILYRPFDVQWIFYHEAVNERLRKEIMRHMMQENLGFVFMRQVALDEAYSHVLVSQHIIDNRAFYSNKGIMSLAPLYLYPDIGKKDLFSHKKEMKKETNISPDVFTALSEVYKKDPTPEEIFNYVYAVLYSNIYRTKYAELLRIDFPRIPFNKDYKLFCKMGTYGKKLVDLHLLKSNDLDQPIAKFQGKGDNKVERVRYEQGKVLINNYQHFEGITLDVWECQIGGYQVCDKWLKDRKGRVLSLDDIRHYCKVVTAIGKTIEIQQAIDEIFSEVEKETINFKL